MELCSGKNAVVNDNERFRSWLKGAKVDLNARMTRVGICRMNTDDDSHCLLSLGWTADFSHHRGRGVISKG